MNKVVMHVLLAGRSGDRRIQVVHCLECQSKWVAHCCTSHDARLGTVRCDGDVRGASARVRG